MNSGRLSKMHRVLPLAVLTILSACAPANGNSGSITVFLSESADLDKLIQCDAGFAKNSYEKFPTTDGSQWIWIKNEDSQLSHYCRQQRDGEVTAWDEAAQNRPATNRLTISASSGQTAFGPIASK